MRRDLPAGTVTFLFTDIEGSTRLLHELGADAYAEALAEHRRILREAFAPPRRRRGRHPGRRLLRRLPDRARGAGGGARGPRGAAPRADPRADGAPHRHAAPDRRGLRRATTCTAARASPPPATAARCCSRRRPRALVDGDALRDLGEHRLKDFAEPVSIFQLGTSASRRSRRSRTRTCPARRARSSAASRGRARSLAASRTARAC